MEKSSNFQNDQNKEQNTPRQGRDEQDQKTRENGKVGSNRQGVRDNDNRNSDVPNIGREDAERTSKETPKM